jgi:Glycosyl hydrolase family 65, C-terminal domain
VTCLVSTVNFSPNGGDHGACLACGAMAGSAAATRRGVLRVDPRLPTSWQCLQVRFLCLGRRVCVTITPEAVKVSADGPIRVQRAGSQPRLVSGRVTFGRLPESGEMNDA